MLNERFIREALRCPVCKAAFICDAESQSLGCSGPRKHSYDISSAAYVNLALPKQSGGGDSKELVRARRAFLAAGYYSKIAEALCDVAKRYASGGLAVDAGCGEGYYTAAIANAAGCDICGVDLSKHAVTAAAKSAKLMIEPRAMFCVAGIFDLPVQDESLDAVFNIFAPCAAEEFYRALKPGGCLIVAGAGKRHLMSLKSLLYDNPRLNLERDDLPKNMSLIEKTKVLYNINIANRDDIFALFSMTPYYYRTSPDRIERLKNAVSLDVDIDVDIYVFKK